MVVLDRMLAIAAWEVIFGGGELFEWQAVIDDLLRRGATLNSKTVSSR